MNDPRLAVDLGAGLRLQNPVMPASGCFGVEMASLVDLNALGALVPKTIFYGARAGNPSPRLRNAGRHAELRGHSSRGHRRFLGRILPTYRRYRPPIIVSIGGLSIREYWDLAARLNGVPGVPPGAQRRPARTSKPAAWRSAPTPSTSPRSSMASCSASTARSSPS